ncbi:hypothetical protein BH10PLA1_BH10PLA1_11120 [soil metagenome]
MSQITALNSFKAAGPFPGRADPNLLWQAISKLEPSPIAAMVSVLPHGAARLVRATPPALAMLRRGEHSIAQLNDETWHALCRNQTPHRHAVQGPDSSEPQPSGTGTTLNACESIALPLKSYTFAGYPAALHLFASPDRAAFNDILRSRVAGIAEQHNASVTDELHRVFVLKSDLSPILNAHAWSLLPPQLVREIAAQASDMLSKTSASSPVVSGRISHTDALGIRSSVRYVAHHSHPAAEGGSCVLIALQPSIAEWMQLRTDDVFADPEFARFLPALQFIHESASKNPALSSIARSIHLSPFHFHRKFAEVVGMTPKQFLLECQITEAQHLLMGSNVELSKVAISCGFAHQSHFTSRFKQATGVTPSQWRKLNRAI